MKEQKTVLIVDDNTFFLRGLSECIEKANIKALTAESWVAITELLQSSLPDLIVLDLVIPSLDGTKICNVLKKSNRTKHIPVLLYSSNKPDELKQLAKDVGADGTLDKSNDFEKIVEDIREFLYHWTVKKKKLKRHAKTPKNFN